MGFLDVLGHFSVTSMGSNSSFKSHPELHWFLPPRAAPPHSEWEQRSRAALQLCDKPGSPRSDVRNAAAPRGSCSPRSWTAVSNGTTGDLRQANQKRGIFQLGPLKKDIWCALLEHRKWTPQIIKHMSPGRAICGGCLGRCSHARSRLLRAVSASTGPICHCGRWKGTGTQVGGALLLRADHRHLWFFHSVAGSALCSAWHVNDLFVDLFGNDWCGFRMQAARLCYLFAFLPSAWLRMDRTIFVVKLNDKILPYPMQPIHLYQVMCPLAAPAGQEGARRVWCLELRLTMLTSMALALPWPWQTWTLMKSTNMGF